MREIKFRVRCAKTKKLVCCYSEGITFTLDTGQIYSGDLNVTQHYVIEQYTGLTDKNGVEIFEGDVIKATSEEGEVISTEVKWKDCCFLIEVIHCEYDYTTLFWAQNQYPYFEYEVIGNIYQSNLMESEG